VKVRTFPNSVAACLAGIAIVCSVAVARSSVKAASQGLVTSWKLLSIKVTGNQRSSPEEITAASGLQVGQMVSEDDFKNATERLGDTGMFGNVGYAFQYSAAGVKLELQLTDTPQLVPARFDNLVWFSDQELLEKLQARVPLFHGQLPVAGGLADQVSDALQALLIEHNVQGQADYIREAALNKPIEAIVFTVKAHDIYIRDVNFPGASAAELPALQTAARPMQGQEYERSAMQVNARLSFLPVYLQRGYLKASFGEAEPKIVQDGAQETTVDVAIPVNPGEQYKLTGIEWSGNSTFPAEQLQSLVHLQTGQPANAVQLDEDLRQVKKLYGTRGRMAAVLRPVPQMDDPRSEVQYQIQVSEGDVYHMGELEIRGLDRRLTDLMNVRWKLQPGDVYDSSYITTFLKETARDLPGDVRWATTIHETPDDKAKTVDVNLTFERHSAQ
jgi:outer membrane protein assembly factor BamA